MNINIKDLEHLIEKEIKDMIDLCPHCGAKVHIEKLWNDYHFLENKKIEYYIAFRCKPCKRLLIKTFCYQNTYRDNYIIIKNEGKKFPALDKILSKKDSECIPKQIFSDYNEALRCKLIGANKASCSMFRRALQNGLLELGANEKENLLSQVDSLKELPKSIKDWAHQIRIFGNWGAHPNKDNLEDINKDDVENIHNFFINFLYYFFIFPERVAFCRKRMKKVKKIIK